MIELCRSVRFQTALAAVSAIILLTACTTGPLPSASGSGLSRVLISASSDSAVSSSSSLHSASASTSFVTDSWISAASQPSGHNSSGTLSSSPVSIPADPTGPSEQFYYAINSTSNEKISYTTPEFSLDARNHGLVRFSVSNPSLASRITVSFTTKEDSVFNSAKSTVVQIEDSVPGEKTYTADLSDCYGFTGILTRIRLQSNIISDGTLTLKSVQIVEGGALYRPFTVGPKIVAATRNRIIRSVPSTALSYGKSYFPDGLMGVLSLGDGKLEFWGSSPVISGVASIVRYRGTYDDPIQTFVSADQTIEGLPVGKGPDEYQYASISQIYNFSGAEYLSVIHLEQHFNSAGSRDGNAYYVSSLALAYSPDRGTTWKYAGLIARQSCEGQTGDEYYGMGGRMPLRLNNGNPLSRDVGNGPFVISDGYLYLYMTDIDQNYTSGYAVLRASVTDCIAAARASENIRLDIFRKYSNGSFKEPGIKGNFSSIIDDECPANFSSILYSEELKKYIFVRCSSPQYSSNDGDIVMNLSSVPYDFRGNNYYIDAGTGGQQYPTVLGLGTDPGFHAGRRIYIYYIDYPVNDVFLWHKANLIRREIVFDPISD